MELLLWANRKKIKNIDIVNCQWARAIPAAQYIGKEHQSLDDKIQRDHYWKCWFVLIHCVALLTTDVIVQSLVPYIVLVVSISLSWIDPVTIGITIQMIGLQVHQKREITNQCPFISSVLAHQCDNTLQNSQYCHWLNARTIYIQWISNNI